MRAALIRAAAAVGVDHAARALQRRRLLVVCYHGIREDEAAERHWLLVPRARFAEQLGHLVARYRVLPLDDALDELAAGGLRRPTACITFDDGYRNNAAIAAPILRAAGAPATIYLATGLIGSPRRLWNTDLELAVRGSRALSVASEPLRLPPTPLGDVTARAALGRRLVERLKGMPRQEKDRALRELLGQLGPERADDGGAYELMSWDEVRALERTGLVTFGAHTASHEIVSRLDDAELAEEVRGSVRAVADAVARPSRTFAYPNGRREDFDPRAARELASVGVTAAVTTIEGLNDPVTPPFALRRVVVGPAMSLAEFRLRTAGVAQMAELVAGRKPAGGARGAQKPALDLGSRPPSGGRADESGVGMGDGGGTPPGARR